MADTSFLDEYRVPHRPHDRALARRNPLLAAWRHFQEPYLVNFQTFDIESFRLDKGAHFRAYGVRTRCVHRYAFAVPSDDALATIATWGPIVQMGAGTGYWAWLLQRDYGVDILPYDIAPPMRGANYWFKRREFVPILPGTPETLSQHPDRTLFLCWPPMSDMAESCLQHYPGRTVIYIGEGDGGCTADDAFFARLEAEWDEVVDLAIPQWEYIHDALTVYQRKPR